MLLIRTGAERRARVAAARLLLIFTPDLAAAEADALHALDAVLELVDVIQVRPKDLADRAPGAAPSRTVASARPALEWTRRVLDMARRLPRDEAPLVLVNDRVDVARVLAEEGLDGVHVGRTDTPPAVVRDLLGDEALIGLSTNSLRHVAASWDDPVDLLGFGPMFPTATKGYGRIDGGGAARNDGPDRPTLRTPEEAWVASETAPVPLFPIGGIDATNAGELERVGRIAVGSAILAAADPARAAAALRAAITPAE